MNVQIRWATRPDIQQILKIDSESFTPAYTEDLLMKELRQKNAICVVAELESKDKPIIGYMIYKLHKDKFELGKFAVAHGYRRAGVASVFIQRLISKLTSIRRTAIEVYMPETNLDGQLFLQKNGFKALRVMKDYYEDGDEHLDAYLMRYSTEELFEVDDNDAETIDYSID